MSNVSLPRLGVFVLVVLKKINCNCSDKVIYKVYVDIMCVSVCVRDREKLVCVYCAGLTGWFLTSVNLL